MKGTPKTLNSWKDVEYVVANFPKEKWEALLQPLINDEIINVWTWEKQLEDGEKGITDDTHKVEEMAGSETEEVTDPVTGDVTQQPKTVRIQYKLIPNLSCRLAMLKHCKNEKELKAAVKEVKALLKKQA